MTQKNVLELFMSLSVKISRWVTAWLSDGRQRVVINGSSTLNIFGPSFTYNINWKHLAHAFSFSPLTPKLLPLYMNRRRPYLEPNSYV